MQTVIKNLAEKHPLSWMNPDAAYDAMEEIFLAFKSELSTMRFRTDLECWIKRGVLLRGIPDSERIFFSPKGWREWNEHLEEERRRVESEGRRKLIDTVERLGVALRTGEALLGVQSLQTGVPAPRLGDLERYERTDMIVQDGRKTWEIRLTQPEGSLA